MKIHKLFHSLNKMPLGLPRLSGSFRPQELRTHKHHHVITLQSSKNIRDLEELLKSPLVPTRVDAGRSSREYQVEATRSQLY